MKGLLLFAGDETENALASIRDAVRAAREIGARMWELRALESSAKYCLGTDEGADSIDRLRAVLESLPENTGSREVEAARRTLAEVSA